MGNERGDPPDIHTLIAEHQAPLYAYAYRLSGRVAEAEDLTQQAFLTAHQKIDQLREPEKARGWLYRILRNAFLKSRRKPEPSTPNSAEPDMESIPVEADSLDIDQQRLQMAIDSLPDQYRLVLMMFYFEELSYKEIAEQLDVKIGTVMSRLARGKSRLRNELLPVARDGSLGGVIPSAELQEPAG